MAGLVSPQASGLGLQMAVSSVCPATVFPLCVSLSSKVTNPIRLGPTHGPHFNLISSSKALCPKQPHSEVLGARTFSHEWRVRGTMRLTTSRGRLGTRSEQGIGKGNPDSVPQREWWVDLWSGVITRRNHFLPQKAWQTQRVPTTPFEGNHRATLLPLQIPIQCDIGPRRLAGSAAPLRKDPLQNQEEIFQLFCGKMNQKSVISLALSTPTETKLILMHFFQGFLSSVNMSVIKASHCIVLCC